MLFFVSTNGSIGYHKEIKGYQISRSKNQDLVIKTLKKAINQKEDLSKLLIHSDQGILCQSPKYRNYLKKSAFTQSIIEYAKNKDIKALKFDKINYISGKGLEGSVGLEIDHIIRKSVSFEWVFMDCRNKKACNDFIDKQFPDLDEFHKQGGILQDSSSKHVFNQNEYEESKLDTDRTNDVLKYMKKI